MKFLSGTAIVITLGALWPASAQTSADNTLPKQIYGRVQVLDGSTIEFIKPRQIVRLAGYLAPRLDQLATTDSVEWPAGQVARAWLILRTLQHDVNCASVTTDANGTILAHCFVEETNLAATAIAEGIGYAFNFPGEPQVPAYFDIERRARGLGFGIWSDPKLTPPWNLKPDHAATSAVGSTSEETPDPASPFLRPLQRHQTIPPEVKMRKLFFTFLIAGCGLTMVSPAMSQPSQPTNVDPDQCGAGGMGCAPAEVQKWMEKGNELANLSSADLSQYAYACAKHPDWKRDCETDPGKVLRRLGITDYQ